jgi:hypothetical protein
MIQHGSKEIDKQTMLKKRNEFEEEQIKNQKMATHIKDKFGGST